MVHPLRPPGPLDHVAAVAARHFSTPVAIVSLVGDQSHSIVGYKAAGPFECSGSRTFIRLAAMSGKVVVRGGLPSEGLSVGSNETARLPCLKFVAGVPLSLDGAQSIGTLCIGDFVLRELSFGQKVIFEHMARMAVQELQRLRDEVCNRLWTR